MRIVRFPSLVFVSFDQRLRLDHQDFDDLSTFNAIQFRLVGQLLLRHLSRSSRWIRMDEQLREPFYIKVRKNFTFSTRTMHTAFVALSFPFDP
jgi:hypothetical protein